MRKKSVDVLGVVAVIAVYSLLIWCVVKAVV